MRAGLLRGPGCAIGAVICALATVPAAAQVQDSAYNAYAYAAPGEAGGAQPADTSINAADEDDVIGRALILDPAALASTTPAKPLKIPNLSALENLAVNRTDRPDGSSTVVVKHPLATEWDSTVGADLNLAAAPNSIEPSRQPFPTTAGSPGSGAAWASVGVAEFASLDARVDPANDQGKMGTTLKQSIPFGQRFSITVQNTNSVTQTFNPITGSTGGTSSTLPMMTLPTGSAPTPPTPQVWADENNVKLNILPTGTTLVAGLATASNDPVTHNTLSADQKLYGPLHITTAVTDAGQPTVNKSISAGLKFNW